MTSVILASAFLFRVIISKPNTSWYATNCKFHPICIYLFYMTLKYSLLICISLDIFLSPAPSFPYVLKPILRTVSISSREFLHFRTSISAEGTALLSACISDKIITLFLSTAAGLEYYQYFILENASVIPSEVENTANPTPIFILDLSTKMSINIPQWWVVRLW